MSDVLRSDPELIFKYTYDHGISNDADDLCPDAAKDLAAQVAILSVIVSAFVCMASVLSLTLFYAMRVAKRPPDDNYSGEPSVVIVQDEQLSYDLEQQASNNQKTLTSNNSSDQESWRDLYDKLPILEKNHHPTSSASLK
jgi:hypothetical protein